MKKWKQFVGAVVLGAVAVSAHAGPRLDRIQESKTLRVGTPGDYRPFAMKTDQGYEGHDIDVIEAMATELGLTIEYVPTTWPNLMPDLQADKFDIAVGGITYPSTHCKNGNASWLRPLWQSRSGSHCR